MTQYYSINKLDTADFHHQLVNSQVIIYPDTVYPDTVYQSIAQYSVNFVRSVEDFLNEND